MTKWLREPDLAQVP